MKKLTPHLILGHGHFFQDTLLSSSRFADYCKKRGINIDERRLEKFEKLGIFYPMLRIKHPRCKKKLKRIITETDNYIEECGILQEGEEWDGEIEIYYADFIFWEKEYVDSWIDDGLVYIPSKVTFQPWSNYRIEDDFQKQTETYYSIFQTLPLYMLTHSIGFPIGIENLATWTQNEIKNWFKSVKQIAKSAVKSFQKSNGIRDEITNFAQILSSRYLPTAEKYDGMISLPQFGSFDWRQYRLNWNAKQVLDELDLSIEQVVRYHEIVEAEASRVDPLDRWSDLVQFIHNSKKEQLKDAALLAQNWRVLGRIINLFHRDLTGDFIHNYGKDTKTKERIYGRGIPQNNLAFLEYVSNEFGVNPRPKLFLFVEGDGEVKHFPRLAIELFGIIFSEIRIQIQNLHGVSGFEGNKKVDKYGAFEKLIEYYHDKQTLAFFILDKEGRVENVKQKLITKTSKEHPNRTVTKDEYIKLWDKNVEFDNFTNKEIASAMTKFSENRYQFTEAEIEDCRNRFGKESDTLSKLYEDKCEGYDSNKIKLLGILIDYAVLSPKFEVDEIEVVRPLVKTLNDVCNLAIKNYQPSRLDSWKETQNSEWLGHKI
jgi:hypothetical protein